MSAPLDGVRVIELGGIGPVPFAGMWLADLGADVVRVRRPAESELLNPTRSAQNRGKRFVTLDLRDKRAHAQLMTLAGMADAVIEGFRPGVAERLGIGPEPMLRARPTLVYGRMTGWGQTGPRSMTAGHDINYISLSGALHAIGPRDGAPQIPLNLLGDYAGGSAYLVTGLLAALIEVRGGGRGQVVDAAIVDGVSHLLAPAYSALHAGQWIDERGANLVDGGAPFYAVYETADRGWFAVGAIEAPFYAALAAGLGLELDLTRQHDRSTWPETRSRFAAAFRTRTRDEWSEVFDGTDACASPVLSMGEAATEPHLLARDCLRARGDHGLRPAPAPRFSNHPAWREPAHGVHEQPMTTLIDAWSAQSGVDQ